MCMLGTAVVVVALLYKGPMLRQAAERSATEETKQNKTGKRRQSTRNTTALHSSHWNFVCVCVCVFQRSVEQQGR